MLCGHAQRLKHTRDAAIIGGWVAAIEQRQKEVHALSEIIGWFEPQPPAEPQTADQMVNAWRGWVMATGGTLAADTAAAPASSTTSDTKEDIQ